jgi:hypothetical protein
MTWLVPLTQPALIVLGIAAITLVIAHDWRIRLAAVAAIYAGVCVLVAPLVIAEVVLAKAVVGVLVAAILALTGHSAHEPSQTQAEAEGTADQLEPAEQPAAQLEPSAAATNLPFRVAAAAMFAAAAMYLASQPAFTLPGLGTLPAANTASYLLMGLGLLNLGLSTEPLPTGMGLLVVLLGFELFYAAVEPSLAVVALLAGSEFAIALAVSYLALTGRRAADPAEAAEGP